MGGARSISEKNKKKTVEIDKTNNYLMTEREGTKIFSKKKVGRCQLFFGVNYLHS